MIITNDIGTTNPILAEYLEGKNPESFYGLNAPSSISLFIAGRMRMFQYVECLSSIREGGKKSEAVYQCIEENRYGLYPIFSVVVKRDKGMKYSFYFNNWDGTRVWH